MLLQYLLLIFSSTSDDSGVIPRRTVISSSDISVLQHKKTTHTESQQAQFEPSVAMTCAKQYNTRYRNIKLPSGQPEKYTYI